MNALMESTILEQKRYRALRRIGLTSMGTAITGAIPAPAFELAKQLGIALANAWMFVDIYEIYFDEELSADKLLDSLGAAGLIVVTGTVVTLSVTAAAQSAIDGLLSLIPIVGWIAAGALASTTTVTFGLAWIAFVETLWADQHPQLPVVI